MEDTLNVDLLRQTEGTTILHVSFAVMEQRELRQEFLKYLKVSCGCVCGQQILLQNPFLSGTGVPQVHEDQLWLFVVSEYCCIITEILECQL